MSDTQYDTYNKFVVFSSSFFYIYLEQVSNVEFVTDKHVIGGCQMYSIKENVGHSVDAVQDEENALLSNNHWIN